MLRQLLLATIALPTCLSAQTRDLTPLVNRIFARWDSAGGPGCSVGIDRAGTPRFTRAFGQADLEYDIPNKPETIFEAGSISKQFTAAATVLLALDGKLNLGDDVRKYVPELPTYERPITIRHLLNHTSGLRDWGEIADLAGWPRETRVHTHDDVLDILSRQRALNYPPGDRYSYTNSGYNLLAIIISRVSGQPFATFSRERIFTPLGLTSTQWRDDFRRVVKRRAQAYSRSGGQWVLEMPFENVHGNGGLLTTVSDLLTWTAMLDKPTPTWKAMVDSLHVRGILTKGDTITYALGLVVSDYRGVPMVEHSGATAGYRAELRRYPGRGLAVAVLCNAATANPVAFANQLVDSMLAPSLGPVAASNQRPRPDSATWKPNASDLAAYAGTYYSPDVETTFEVSVTNGALTLFRRPAMRAVLRPTSTDRFGGFNNGVWFTRDASGRVTALHVAGGRAYDVVFERREGGASAAPRVPQSLFNGRDLSGWHVDVPADSNVRVRNPFIVRDGMLVSLGEPRGHLITDSIYRDYRLEVEYRFPGKPGNAGVLVHASTPRALYKMFPRSIEVQMEHGNAGDFWCILEDVRVPDMERRRGPQAQWGTTEGKARRILNLTDDSEKPLGQWNAMAIEAVGRSIRVWVNGTLVNEGSDATADRGQIALQSEGSEVEFRKVSLTTK